MSVTYAAPLQLAANTWRLTWSSSLGVPGVAFAGYRIFKNGVQVGEETTAEQLDVTLQAGESLVIEVLDDADEEPSTGFPGRITLGWGPVEPASSIREYKVQEYVSAVWTTRKLVTEDGSPFYRFESRYLEDDTTHQFRVIPVGVNGNDGTALSFSALMVRHPDQPIADSALDSRFTYNGAVPKTVTISAS